MLWIIFWHKIWWLSSSKTISPRFRCLLYSLYSSFSPSSSVSFSWYDRARCKAFFSSFVSSYFHRVLFPASWCNNRLLHTDPCWSLPYLSRFRLLKREMWQNNLMMKDMWKYYELPLIRLRVYLLFYPFGCFSSVYQMSYGPGIGAFLCPHI